MSEFPMLRRLANLKIRVTSNLCRENRCENAVFPGIEAKECLRLLHQLNEAWARIFENNGYYNYASRADWGKHDGNATF